MGGRTQVKPHDVFEFFGKERIVAQLEAANPVRLDPVLMPDAPHRSFARAAGFSHESRAPVRRVGRNRLGGERHDALSIDLARTTGTFHFLFQGLHASSQKAPTPTTGLVPTKAQPSANAQIGLS